MQYRFRVLIEDKNKNFTNLRSFRKVETTSLIELFEITRFGRIGLSKINHALDHLFYSCFFAKNLPVLTGKSNSRMMLKYIKAFKNNFFEEIRNWL